MRLLFTALACLISVSVFGQGCENPPSIGLASPGNTDGLCTPASITFSMLNFETNDPSTVYWLDFGNGSGQELMASNVGSSLLDENGNSISYYANAIFNHENMINYITSTYTNSSCGNVTPLGSQNAFMFQAIAVNECGISVASIDPIRIHGTPNPIISGPEEVCVSESIFWPNEPSAFYSPQSGFWAGYNGCYEGEVYWQVQLPPGGPENLALEEASPSYNTTSQDSLSTFFLEPGEYLIYVQEMHSTCVSSDDYHSVCVYPDELTPEIYFEVLECNSEIIKLLLYDNEEENCWNIDDRVWTVSSMGGVSYESGYDIYSDSLIVYVSSESEINVSLSQYSITDNCGIIEGNSISSIYIYDSDVDSDGICDDDDDCVGELDVCGLCNGPGAIYECGCSDVPEGDCDCDGNQLDAIGECGGDCYADDDLDGLCDDIDECIGNYDECGVCNGGGIAEGACDCDGNILDECGVCGGEGIAEGACDCDGNVLDECGVCGGEGIAESACDCDGNVLDECGVCGGDNGSCTGCILSWACNYDDSAIIAGECIFPEEYYNCDEECINDIDNDGICDELEILGCDDLYACNYNGSVTELDGSCLYVGDACDDGNESTENDAYEVNCECIGEEVVIISGCINESACNYDPEADVDNNTCLFVGDPCDDGDPNTLDDEIQEDCECAGTLNSSVDELEALSVLIYPNPASNNLTVDLGDLNGLNTIIKLYDSSSKLVFEKQSTSTLMIDVSGFAKGMYSLELSTDEQVLRSQVIID